MMGGMGMMGRGMMGGMRGATWAMNGMSMTGDGQPDMPPLFTLKRGQTCVLALRNETAWWHPMHLHGHSFRVISRNGKPNPRREWRDTVLVPPRESAEIAFVADNPGDWMFHCHVTDHQEAGMMAVHPGGMRAAMHSLRNWSAGDRRDVGACRDPGMAAGDAEKGAAVFRACAACHSLKPDRNMTGPSLAGFWERKAGALASFERYSPALNHRRRLGRYLARRVA